MDLNPERGLESRKAVFPRADKKEVLEKIEAMENEIRNPGAAAPATSNEPQVTSQSAGKPAPAPGRRGNGCGSQRRPHRRRSESKTSPKSNCVSAW